jgi:hypothetical protein
MEDDGGVLGNLPRSRPGRRSDKRAAAPSQVRTEHAEPPEQPSHQEPAGGSPIGGVTRALTSLAGGGARAAHGIAREALRRLPRP